MGIYFFYGDEDYLIDAELKKFRDKLDANFSAMNYTTYSKLPYADLISIIRTQPMMFGKMMIVINCLDLLSASLDDKQIKEISSALECNTDMLDIFFVAKYPRDDKKKKPDTRRKIYKLLSKYNKQEFATIPTYKTAELVKHINDMAKSKNIKVNNDAAMLIIENKGNNLREFDVELDKLQLLAYPNKTITKEMVNKICISNEDIFNLTDYIMAGNKGKALLEMKRLLDKKHPLEILAPVQTLLKKWIFFKLNSKTMSCAEMGHKIGMNEFAIKKTLEKLKNIKVKNLVDLRKHLTEAEYRIKSGQAYSPEEELENAIIR